jgi:hypothetical protein
LSFDFFNPTSHRHQSRAEEAQDASATLPMLAVAAEPFDDPDYHFKIE